MRRTTAIVTGAIAIVLAMLVVGLLLLRTSHHRSAATGATGVTGRSLRTPWSRVEIDGRRVQVDYAGSPCEAQSHLVVDERPDRVVLTLYVEPSRRMCIALATGHQAEARLHTPLAGRPVYDGACLAGATESATGSAAASCRRRPQ